MSATLKAALTGKRKRSLVGGGEDTNGASTSTSAPLRHRPTGSISNLIEMMDIDDARTVVVHARPAKPLKRRHSRQVPAPPERASSLASVSTIPDEEVHVRSKRRKEEPTAPPQPVLPQPPVVDNTPATRKSRKPPRGPVAAVVLEESSQGDGKMDIQFPGDATLTPMQKAMKERLQGSAFRYYNEMVYKTDSKEFYKKVKEDPKIFSEYHAGFRRQVTSWPSNPAQHYENILSSYPPYTMIVDLGCGDAALAKALVPKGFRVASFDLVSDGEWVVEADVCDKIPLPGSDRGAGRIVDVVVCSLSLMSLNWPQCIREARRILKDDGELKIAEVTSRFTNIKDFVSLVSSLGFQLVKQEQPTTHFTLFDFKVAPPPPVMSAKEWKAIAKKASILKPCEYKRR